MTVYANNVFQNQLVHIMNDEQAILLSPDVVQSGDVLMFDEMGQSIYDVAAQADETGVWVFLGNAINSDQMVYGQDWQQNPSVTHEMPDDVALGVPEKASQLSISTKWLLGGLATVGALALGAGLGGGGDGEPHHELERVAEQIIPQPRALVQQFSSNHNPENPNERAAVVQAEPPVEREKEPMKFVDANTQIAVLIEENQVNNMDNLSEISHSEYEVQPDLLGLPAEILANSVNPTEQLG